jgi:hypothetical protein
VDCQATATDGESVDEQVAGETDQTPADSGGGDDWDRESAQHLVSEQCLRNNRGRKSSYACGRETTEDEARADDEDDGVCWAAMGNRQLLVDVRQGSSPDETAKPHPGGDWADKNSENSDTRSTTEESATEVSWLVHILS